MLEFPRWKVIWLWAITLVAALAAAPSLMSTMGFAIPSGVYAPKVNLGLDLAGGSHILLEADPAQVRQQRADALRLAPFARREPAAQFVPAQVGEVAQALHQRTQRALGGWRGKQQWLCQQCSSF